MFEIRLARMLLICNCNEPRPSLVCSDIYIPTPTKFLWSPLTDCAPTFFIVFTMCFKRGLSFSFSLACFGYYFGAIVFYLVWDVIIQVQTGVTFQIWTFLSYANLYCCNTLRNAFNLDIFNTSVILAKNTRNGHFF